MVKMYNKVHRYVTVILLIFNYKLLQVTSDGAVIKDGPTHLYKEKELESSIEEKLNTIWNDCKEESGSTFWYGQWGIERFKWIHGNCAIIYRENWESQGIQPMQDDCHA